MNVPGAQAGPANPGGAISQFENLVAARQWKPALAGLANLLEHLSERGALADWCLAASEEDVLIACTRIASAVTTMFVDPGCEVEQEDYAHLVNRSTDLAHVFLLSGYRSADVLLSRLRERAGQPGANPGPVAFRDKSDARKFLLSVSIYCRHAEAIFDLLKLDPASIHPTYLRMLTAYLSLDHETQERRHRLLGATEQLSAIVPRVDSLDALHHVWALCSYSLEKTKHQTKGHLNSALCNLLAKNKIEPPSAANSARPKKDRPTLLVACEVMAADHVMNRCYGPFYRQLQQRFRVVVLIAREDLGPGEIDWCDELVTFSSSPLQLREIVGLVEKIDPDISLFPCIGMRLWGVILSNMRLAPIQVGTLGHPASSFSQAIDCMLVGGEVFGGSECFSEPVALLRSPGNIYDLSRDASRPKPDFRAEPERLRIAICANLLKLNATFLDACVQIGRRARRPIEFRFMPNVLGPRYLVARNQIGRRMAQIPHIVYPRRPFAEYVKQLGQCDLYLSTFPFGGENSVLDALLQGLPIVTLEGAEPHGRLDARVLRLFGMPDWTITNNAEAYVDTALRLIHDEDQRRELFGHLADPATPARVGAEQVDYPSDFVDTLWWIYENQERVRHGDERLWRPEDRA